MVPEHFIIGMLIILQLFTFFVLLLLVQDIKNLKDVVRAHRRIFGREIDQLEGYVDRVFEKIQKGTLNEDV